MKQQSMNKDVIAIDIRTEGASDYIPTLSVYYENNRQTQRPAVLIFSGGAYKSVCQYEATPTAMKYAKNGFVAFTVNYSCLPAVFPQSLCEGFWSLKYIRDRAEEYGIDRNNVTVMGFSAGGHLAAAMGTLWNSDFLTPYLGESRECFRPDKMVLCYPVLSNQGHFHRDTYVNLLGKAGMESKELLDMVCLEKQVTDTTPPAFIWHGYSDTCVPCEGSLRFVEALVSHHVLTEFHLYPFAPHGGGLNLGLAQGDWSDKAMVFMKDKNIR